MLPALKNLSLLQRGERAPPLIREGEICLNLVHNSQKISLGESEVAVIRLSTGIG